MEWNWLTIAVAGVFLLGFLIGIYRGAIRIAVSLATTILTIVIVVAASPYVSSAIEKHTPIDDMIKSQVTNTMAKAAASQLTGGSDDNGSTGISAESVRKALKAAGISEEELQSYGVSVDDIVNGKITGEQLAQYGISSSILDGVNNDEVSEEVKNAIEGADIPRDLQVAAIEKADLPAVFKTQLSTNNNIEIYSQLGVQTFAQYVGEFLSKLIIHIIAFLGTFLIVTIILRAIVFCPFVFNNVTVGFIWQFLLGRFMTDLYPLTGWKVFNIGWLSDNSLVLYSVVFVKLWQSIGYFMVIYLAGLQLLPQDPLEAAVIDGCTGIKMIRYITIPLMKPTAFVCIFLAITESLNMFPLIMSLTNGGPGHASENISLYIYNEAFKSHRMGYASALAVILTIIMTIIAGLQMKLTREDAG